MLLKLKQIHTFNWKLIISKTGSDNNFNFVTSVGDKLVVSKSGDACMPKSWQKYVNKLTKVLKKHNAENKTVTI